MSEGVEELPPILKSAIELFNDGRYLAAHELLEELWEGSAGSESDFYKGLLQAAIALHHFEAGNRQGAAKLYGGHRRYLGRFLPEHRGLDLVAFLTEMQRYLGPAHARSTIADAVIRHEDRPRLLRKTGG